MRSKLFWAGAFVCLATACSVGQDPTRVEPKHYKLDFENDRVQVLSVHYGPHEKSVFHDHPGGKTREVFSKAGEVRWYPPFKHRVENLGDTTYDGVYIGVKGKLAAASNGSANATRAMDEETRKIVAEYLLASGKP